MRRKPRQLRLPDAVQRRRLEHSPRTAPSHPTTNRVEQFSDGVISIIITIMVLGLKLPALPKNFSGTELLAAAHQLAPNLLAYALSFFIIAIFWVNHHDFFHSLRNTDPKLIWINNFLLFWLSLVPFATAFLGEHPTTPAALMAFGFLLMMAAACFPLMTYYTIYMGHLTHDDVSMELRRQTFRRSLPGFVLYLCSIVAAPFSVWFSWIILFSVPVYYLLPQRSLKVRGFTPVNRS
ncbi:MAG: TMEM175 family protein [Saprospiraceae bacterium]